MAATTGGLTYVFDENSAGLLTVLRAARGDDADDLSDLPSLGISNGTLDQALLTGLGQIGRVALIVRDSRILEPFLQRQGWLRSGVTLFILTGWGQFRLFELARRLLFLWPALKQHAEERGQGLAWRVRATMPDASAAAFRLVTGRQSAP